MAVEVVDWKGPTRLGSYEILRKLAKGGMAELFLARTVGAQDLDKLVVLKKVLPQYAALPRFVRLFLDEAKLAAGLEHPHIAHVFDMGTVDGNYFFAMEFVHGQDVRSTLHRGWQAKRRMPIEQVVQVGRAIASALHYAHERRRADGTLLDIVHRDVSPSNIMLSYDGTIKLLDFGVAKASSSSTKTRTGTLKGKVSYMSPEQAKGAPVDRRSDIFSLGIVLWEMLTGARLFRGENDLATIQMIINQPPPSPSNLRPDCPPELERILLRALAPDPAARISTARELETELEALGLDPSPGSLGAYLGDLFAPEIKDWHEAHDSPITSVPESDLSIFEHEIEAPDLDEDDDDDEAGTVDADPIEITDTASISTDELVPPRLIAVARTGSRDLVPAPPVLPGARVLPLMPGEDDDEDQTVHDRRSDLDLPSIDEPTTLMPPPVAPRVDATPIPFPTISRDAWTRAAPGYDPGPTSLDLEAALARRRLRIAGAVFGVVLVVLAICAATGGTTAPASIITKPLPVSAPVR